MYKFTKLLLNKFISFFFFFLNKRVILNETTKKVPQLDLFFKYLLVFFSNSFKDEVGV